MFKSKTIFGASSYDRDLSFSDAYLGGCVWGIQLSELGVDRLTKKSVYIYIYIFKHTRRTFTIKRTLHVCAFSRKITAGINARAKSINIALITTETQI